jgi:hypothetical protein
MKKRVPKLVNLLLFAFFVPLREIFCTQRHKERKEINNNQLAPGS